MSQEKPLYYRLDSADLIIEVGGEWDRFAEENGGSAVVADRVLGTPLFKHISGMASRDYIWTAVDSVRKLLTPRRFAYRCDSPDLKRFMEMVIKPDDAGGVLMEHYTLRVEPLRPKVVVMAGRDGVPALTIRCSMCSRIRRRGTWLEPDAAVAQNIIAPDIPNTVAYGVCTDCRQAAGSAPSS